MCHGSTFDFRGEYPFDDHWIGNYKTVKLIRLVDKSVLGKISFEKGISGLVKEFISDPIVDSNRLFIVPS